VGQFKGLEANLTIQNPIKQEINVRVRCSQGMLTVIQCRIFRLPIYFPKNERI